ncbi:hypothetical protein ACWDTD_09025 [Gordonia sp. NPDC003425]
MSFEVVAIVIVAWATISVVVALIIGAIIRMSDTREDARELNSVAERPDHSRLDDEHPGGHTPL